MSTHPGKEFRAPWLVFWVAFAVRVLYLTLAHTYRIRPYDDHMLFGEEVGRTRYLDARGREKEVRYFRMSASGEPFAQNEVDELRWVPLAEAAAFLSYPNQAALLARLP